MNLEQIVDEINSDLDDDSIELTELKGWINRCIDDISPIAKKEAIFTAELSPFNRFELPNDYLDMEYLFVNGSSYDEVPMTDSKQTGYKQWGNMLTLQNAPSDGSMELYYYKRLKHLENNEDVPEIEEPFHDLLVLYTVAHYQYKEEEPEQEADALTRYNARRQEYQVYRQRKAPIIQNTITDAYGW